MKRTLTSIALGLIATGASAQVVSYTTLEDNNARATIENNGCFFTKNVLQSGPGYEVPKDSGLNVIFMMNIMASGKDANGQIKAAAGTISGSDFFFGPMATDYNAPHYMNYSTIWKVSKAQVDNHIAHWNDAGYIAPATITHWPGNGNVANGEAAIIAPFRDLNANGLYEPAQGEYPEIRGDYAAFCVVNDHKDVHPSGTEPIGLEVRMLFYQYAAPEVKYSTFIHLDVINFSTQTLNDFHFGSLIDFDLGNLADDYLGTSVEHNMAYVYNADLFDEPNGGHPGYGTTPPAAGVITLNKPLASHVLATQGLDSQTIDNMLNGIYADGSPQIDNEGQQTLYHCSGFRNEGWTSVGSSSVPGDRRGVVAFPGITLRPWNVLCYDYAVVYAENSVDGDLFNCVDSLFAEATTVQAFWDDQQFNCMDGQLSISEQEIQPLVVYPNPTSGTLTVDGVTEGEFELFSTDGKRIKGGRITNGNITLENVWDGYYLLLVKDGTTTRTTRIVKK